MTVFSPIQLMHANSKMLVRLVVVLIVFGSGLIVFNREQFRHYLRYRAKRHACIETLKSIGAAIQLYRGDTGLIPSHWSDLEDSVGCSLSNLLQQSHLESNQRYHLLQYPAGVCSGNTIVPIVVETDASNHDYRGIHVLWSDGSVEWHQQRESQ